MTGATWLGEAARYVGRFFPRLRHLECTDIGVCIKRGTMVKILEPGLHCFWPIWTSFYCRPANIQTCIVPPKSLTTLDSKVVVAGAMLRYEFQRSEKAVQKALIDTNDVEGALVDEATAILCAFVTSKPIDEIRMERAKVNRSLTGKLATQLAQYGVEVLRAQLTDFSPSLTLNHVGISFEHACEDEEEE
jgi:regulator of protease activity HflC (stomatin/prohibitin superfamily)